MDYIQQAYRGLYDLWRYILGVVIVFIAWQLIGMIPLVGGLAVKILGDSSVNMPTDIPQMIDILGSNLFLLLMLLSFVFGLIGVFVTSKTLHKQSITSLTTARKKIDWKRFWFIFILWGIVSSGFVLLDYYMSPDDYQLNFKLEPFLILAVIAILLIPLQTSFEEYFFRGYLMQGFGVIFKNKWLPLLITSVGFGLMHIANPEVDKLGPVIMVYYIGTGLFLGIMTLMDDGLELALGFHAANNLFTALLVTADWTAFQTDSILKDLSDPTEMGLMEIFVPVFVVFPILLFILSKKYNWTNWKDKLFGEVIEPPKEDYKVLD
ncbi:CPBP family intramembrane metalloprotease domain-containing protein [Algibacter marinivivus]|uniref:CPBP family intramembrane metalloprotease domain-containing protein n=1 Tax=Algibacter marinivivus TaxID=2100723 RepID=A0A2U2X561_9FLAO|nr:CPBP family intramembrane glutamic endopeptidase [Algibacter marinivivus]PWH82880.1 CPBP family intramembrane metalloprotease domain-containing protein [Algibacter marinivivus]